MITQLSILIISIWSQILAHMKPNRLLLLLKNRRKEGRGFHLNKTQYNLKVMLEFASWPHSIFIPRAAFIPVLQLNSHYGTVIHLLGMLTLEPGQNPASPLHFQLRAPGIFSCSRQKCTRLEPSLCVICTGSCIQI